MIKLLLCLFITKKAIAADFFATNKVQRRFPHAFALQPESRKFLKESYKKTIEYGDRLIKAIKHDHHLYTAILNWENLSMKEQIPYLRRVFELEYKALNIQPPQLKINDPKMQRGAFFEFDPNKPGTGTVYINTRKLKNYESLALIIHETFHSAQFQYAFSNNKSAHAKAHKEAFIAQKQLFGKLGFCDFLTLNNEYEAFLLGNYVLGKLTYWKLEMLGMGTFASQFNQQGHLRINLLDLSQKLGNESLLDKFNILEIEQKKLLKR